MDETRNANVNLTADVSQYNQATMQASRNTSTLTDQVNKLASSLDGITKRLGKKLIIFSAADTAAMTAYTAVAAKYEKQLTTLRAQTELAGKSITSYKKGINDLARDLPITGGEIVRLVTQINQLGITSERQALAMARTFTNLSAATGDDIGALTQGLIELSRQMGTLGSGATGIQNFADSLTTVSNKAGVSATAVLSFSQAIAPMARAAGIGQKEVLGISTAFTRAGADGFAAANTFNSMVSDITRQVMTSSPELAKYASAVGMTVEQFANLDSTERIVQIFEAVTKAGPDAVRVIDRLGYDGIRAAKSIQAVANESGGLRKAITEARDAFGSGSTERGAGAAFSGLDSQMTKLRNNLEQIAAQIGDYLVPATAAFVAVLNKGLDVINQMAGPLLSVAGAIGALLAPVAGAFGMLMSAMGPLSTVMLAMTALKFSPLQAGLQGIKEGMAAKTAATYGQTYVPVTQAGRHNAAGDLRRYQQGPYNLGERLGQRIAGPPGPIPLQQLALRSAIGASDMTRSWYLDPTRQLLANAAMKDPFLRKSVTGDVLDKAYEGSKGLGGAMRQAITNPYAFLMARGGPTPPPGTPGAVPTPPKPSFDVKAARMAARTAAEDILRAGGTNDDAMKAYKQTIDSQRALAKSVDATSAANKLQVRTMADLRHSLALTGRNIATLPLAYGRMGAGLAAQGIGKVAGAGFGMLGSMVGMGAGAGAAIAGVGALGYGVMKTREGSTASVISEETAVNLARTNAALGLATESLGEFQKRVESSARSAGELTTAAKGFAVTAAERALASGREYADTRVAGLTDKNAAIAFLSAMGEVNGEQARSLSLDLSKRFGATLAKVITDASLAQGKQYNEYTRPMGEMSKALFASAAANTNAGVVGGLRNFGLNGLVGVDTNTTEQVQAGWLSAIEQSQNVGVKYGPEAEIAKLAANSISLLGSAFGLGDDAGARTVQEQSVKQWESIYGELGLTTGGQGLTSSFMGGKTLNDIDSFMKYVLDPNNTASGAVNFRGQLTAAGLGASDIYGPQKKSMDELAISLQRGSMSAFERNVRSTPVGEFARTSGAVLDVTEGKKIGDTQAIGAATDALVRELTRGGASIGEVTTQTQKLARAAGSASDPLFQLAQSAQQLASVQAEAKGKREGGWVGSLSARWEQNQAMLTTPKPGDERNQALVNWEAMKAEGEEQAGAYLLALDSYQTSVERSREDFHKSMLYAEQDFAKSMRRATEDAARSMYDPFKRAYNTGTTSLDATLSNMKRHRELIAEQVKNIEKLKKEGFSQQAIDMMDLTNPANAFRVQRFVDSGVSRAQVRRANRLAAGTQNAAGDLVQEQQGTRRAIEDFATTQARGADGFRKSLRRAAEDFAKYGKEALGTYEELLERIDRKIKKTNLKGIELPFRAKLDEVTKLLDGYLAKEAPMAQGEKGGPTPQYDAYNPEPSTELQGGYQTGRDYPAGRRRGNPATRAIPPTRSVSPGTYPSGGPAGDPRARAVAPTARSVTHSDAKTVRTAGYTVPASGKGGATTMNYATNYNIQKMSVESKDMTAWEREVARKTRQRNQRMGQNAPLSV